MEDINFDRLRETATEIFTLYQSAVINYGPKSLADDLKKSKTTIYAEMPLENLHTYLDTIENYDDLGKKPSYLPKQGLVDFIVGMLMSCDTRPLVAMAAFFNMACFKIPKQDLDTDDLLVLLQEVNREHFEHGTEVLESIKDRDFSKADARAVSKEAGELINAVAAIKQVADARAQD